MLILTLDTTTDISSIAVGSETGMLGEYNFAHKMDLSRRLMQNIVSLVKDCGLEMRDLGVMGISLGPGSFTGIRIGVATGKTLAQVLQVPVVGVVSLDLLAHQFDHLPDSIVCPIVKVRRGEVYYAFYRTHSGSLERISEYAAETVEDLVDRAREIEGGSIIFCGDALKEVLPALQDGLGSRVVPAPAWLSYPKASILARIAMEKTVAGEAADPLSIMPFYIRRSAPEMRAESSCR